MTTLAGTTTQAANALAKIHGIDLQSPAAKSMRVFRVWRIAVLICGVLVLGFSTALMIVRVML